jgi:proteic killer suppression protein
MAIQSFSDADTDELFTTGKCKRFAAIASVATRKLTQLDNAPTLNFKWRLTFRWGDAGPYDVLIEDPH